MSNKIEITLKRSLAGCREDQRATAIGLGLKRPHSKVVKDDTPSIRGMIEKIRHLLSVKEI